MTASTPSAHASAAAFRDLLMLASVMVVSRLIAYSAGVRFDLGPIDWFWQYADPALLRTDPWRTAWYMHAQPPLMNLIVAAVLKLPGDASAWSVAIFSGAGYAMTASVYFILRGLAFRPVSCVAAAALFAVSPAVILYENWLFYPYLVAALLAVATASLQRFVSSGSAWLGLLAFGSTAAVIALRSAFHLAWFALPLALCWWAMPTRRRRVALIALIPFVVAASPYVRGTFLIGQFTSSTWLGMSLARVAVRALGAEKLNQLADRGVIGPVWHVDPFSTVTTYARVLPMPSADWPAHPVLSAEVRPSGEPNYNHPIYVDASHAYRRDIPRLAWMFPSEFAGTWLDNVRAFWIQPWHVLHLSVGNTRAIGRWASWWDRWVYGNIAAFRRDRPSAEMAGVSVVFLFFVLLGVVSSIASVVDHRLSSESTVALLFLLVTTAYVITVTSLAETGENSRFRFEVEPLLWICAVIGIARAWRTVAPSKFTPA